MGNSLLLTNSLENRNTEKMIKKEDVPVLTHLLNKLRNSEDEAIGCNSLPDFVKNGIVNEELENKFRYFANIFRTYDIGEYFDNGFGWVVIRPKPNMYSFDFEKEYVNQQKKAEKETIELEKSILDIKLKKWQLKTFWWIFAVAIIGSCLSIYNFTNNLLTSKNTEKQEVKIQQMELELKKLHTLILSQKTNGSLNNQKDLIQKNK